MPSRPVRTEAADAASWTPDQEARLRGLVAARTLQRSDDGFVLASGRRSSFIFNLKNLFGHPEGAALVTARLLRQLGSMDCAYVAGLELGAVFPVTSVVAASHDTGQDLHGFIVRKKPKGHGTLNRVEGLHAGDPRTGRVVVIEDVTTTGTSLLEAVQVVRGLGFTVEEAITIVDRDEGAVEALASSGVNLHALFRKRDFLDPDIT